MTPRRELNVTAYRVIINNNIYIVTLERLKNTPSGNPRYKASIIKIKDLDVQQTVAVYIFYGHYQGEEQEAYDIVMYHNGVIMNR